MCVVVDVPLLRKSSSIGVHVSGVTPCILKYVSLRLPKVTLSSPLKRPPKDIFLPPRFNLEYSSTSFEVPHSVASDMLSRRLKEGTGTLST